MYLRIVLNTIRKIHSLHKILCELRAFSVPLWFQRWQFGWPLGLESFYLPFWF